MILEKPLQEYLDWALSEDPIISVETSFYRDLTEEEKNYINEHLKQQGTHVICFQCDTCTEYSNGKETFHIDRITLRD